MARKRVNFGVLPCVALSLAGCNGVQAVTNTATVNSSADNLTVAALPTTADARQAPAQAEAESGAFQAVFGKASPVAVKVHGDEEITSSEQLIRLGDRAVLITKTQRKQGCHYCAGWLGIYYLKPAGDTFTVTGRFPHALDGSGGAPDWSLSDRFGSLAIESRSGSGGSGSACNWLELVDLAPEGPRKLAKVTLDLDFTGDGPRPEPGSLQVTGKVGKIVPGKSFTIDYTGIQIGVGKRSFSETYLRTAKGYVRVGKGKIDPCPNPSLSE